MDVLNFEKIEMNNFLNDRDHAVATFDLDFKAANYSKNAGSSMIFRAVPVYSGQIYKTDENRQLPFELRQSFEDEYEISFALPKNYRMEEMPENVSLSSEFGTYKLTFAKNGEEVKVSRIMRINKGLYPKEKYNEYIKFRKKIISNDNSKILISKT